MMGRWPATLDARILRTLRGASVHVPAGELAEQLGVSLEQVEQVLEGLRVAGFDIESRPGLGCRLVAEPDRIMADDLYSRLEDSPVAGEILVFEETASTNDVAQRLGREGHPGAVIVFAERQTAGRGRFGRRWDSADHAGLWFSLLLRPEWPVARWPRLTTWAGVCVARAVERFVQKDVQLKWPNDVLIQGRKIAGILIESAVDASGALFAVAGIGVNVNQVEFPEELEGRAASLRQFAGEALPRVALAAVLLEELGKGWVCLAADFSRTVTEAARRSSLLGSWVTLHAGGASTEGVAEGLNEDGQLLLRVNDGSLRCMSAGEVTTQAPPV